VHLNIKKAREISPERRADIINFMKQLVNTNLHLCNHDLELMDIVYAGMLVEYASQSTSIPLRVSVKGPAGSSDETFDCVQSIINNHEREFRDYVR